MEDDFLWESTTVDEKEQELWNVLFEQIVKGNVIPEIGPECVHVGGKSSMPAIIMRVEQRINSKICHLSYNCWILYSKRLICKYK